MLHHRRILILFYLLIFWLGVTTLKAQYRDDHLEPADSYYNIGIVQPTLSKGLSGYPLAQVAVLPPLTSAYVLSIRQESQRYYLVYFKTKLSPEIISRSKEGPLPDSKVQQIKITPELAQALAELWNAAIQQTRYPEPQMRMRGDGTSFVFSALKPGVGMRVGTTWSPKDDTHIASLVGIVMGLQRLATTDSSPIQQQEMLQNARHLLQQLQLN